MAPRSFRAVDVPPERSRRTRPRGPLGRLLLRRFVPTIALSAGAAQSASLHLLGGRTYLRLRVHAEGPGGCWLARYGMEVYRALAIIEN